MRDRDQRLAPPSRRRARCAASQATPSTSRWLVGPSSSSRSGSATSRAAMATRRRSPPESTPTVASRPPTPAASMLPNSPVSTSRTRGSAAHSCSAASPSTASRTLDAGSSTSACARNPTSRSPVRTARPESSAFRPASTASNVDLPPPLRPPRRWSRPPRHRGSRNPARARSRTTGRPAPPTPDSPCPPSAPRPARVAPGPAQFSFAQLARRDARPVRGPAPQASRAARRQLASDPQPSCSPSAGPRLRHDMRAVRRAGRAHHVRGRPGGHQRDR